MDMQDTTIKLSKLKVNKDNPRNISKRKFDQLIINVLKYAKFFQNRPIVHDNYVIQGGNQRYRAIKHILSLEESEFNKLCHDNMLDGDLHEQWIALRKDKSIPAAWVADMANYTAEEIQAFLIIDNENAGEWDWEALANKWDENKLQGWGVDMNWKAGKDLIPGEEPAGAKLVSFTAKNSPSSNDYANLEFVILHTEKVAIINTLDDIRKSENLEKQADALMYLINFYNKHKAQ